MIKISKHKIHATGDDANGLLIALASDEQLQEWLRGGTGSALSERFREMVREAIAAREKARKDA